MKKKFTGSDMFLSILAIMLIGVSFYQTWLGLKQVFGPSSFVISLVLSLLLLFLLWKLRQAKSNGLSTLGTSGIYIFIALFCFTANFNAMYTRFMTKDIYTTGLRQLNDSFSSLETNVESKLNYAIPDVNTRQAVRGDLNNLKIQIKDPKNQGIGPEARQILNRIEKLIGKPITPLTPINESPEGYADLADRMEDQILQMVYNLNPDEKILMADIHSASSKWNITFQEIITASDDTINSKSQAVIDKSLAEYNKLGFRAQTLLGKEKFEFVPSRTNTQEIGKIGFAFNHAVNNFGMYQFVVLMGCVLLDFGIMIIILLVPADNRGSGGNNGSVFVNKRSGKTLIPNS